MATLKGLIFGAAGAVNAPAPPAADVPPEVLSLRAFRAVGDGAADDRAALVRGLDALDSAGGGVLLVPPGTYKVRATAAQPFVEVPAGVTIRGVPGKSRLVLESDDPGAYRELVRVTGDGAALEGLTLGRSAAVGTAVLVKLFPSAGLRLRGCTIDGGMPGLAGDVHGVEVSDIAAALYRDIAMEGCTVTRCAYGLFMTNDATATMRGFRATGCRFYRNRADDLQFNAPLGTMTDISVQCCTFEENLGSGPDTGAGFGFGLANAQRANLIGCHFFNYRCHAVHIEDRSRYVVIQGNTFVSCGKLGYAVINIIDESNHVAILGNHFDQRAVTGVFPVVKVTPGGVGLPNPTEVTVADNHMDLGANYNGIEMFSVHGAVIRGNTIHGTGVVTDGVYAGGSNYGINVRNGGEVIVADNWIRGLSAAFEDGDAPCLTAAAGDSSVRGNLIRDCDQGMPGYFGFAGANVFKLVVEAGG